MSHETQYPDDENGEVLQQWAASGVDLESPRMMDFEHQFDDRESAEGFRAAVVGAGMDAVLYPPEPDDAAGKWEVTCRERMVPTHHAITDTERRLAEMAERFGGWADGWGSMSNADGSPAE